MLQSFDILASNGGVRPYIRRTALILSFWTYLGVIITLLEIEILISPRQQLDTTLLDKTAPFHKYKVSRSALRLGSSRTGAISVTPNVTKCDIGWCSHREGKRIFGFFRIFVGGG